MYEDIERSADSIEYSEAERVAIEYTEKFALDHLSIDDRMFDRLREHFSDPDILELTAIIARHLAFGRLTKVLEIDIACPLPV
jgi:alkylhydroperoxidase family enzyme